MLPFLSLADSVDLPHRQQATVGCFNWCHFVRENKAVVVFDLDSLFLYTYICRQCHVSEVSPLASALCMQHLLCNMCQQLWS